MAQRAIQGGTSASGVCLAESKWPPQVQQCEQALRPPLLDARVGLSGDCGDFLAPGAISCCSRVDGRWSQKQLSTAEQC